MPPSPLPPRIQRQRYMPKLGMGIAMVMVCLVVSLLVWREKLSELTLASRRIAAVNPELARTPKGPTDKQGVAEAVPALSPLPHAVPAPGSIAKRGLHWLTRHQAPDGRWSADYTSTCTRQGHHCDPEIDHLGVDGEVARTALALLCFLGAGYDHRLPGEFRGTTRAGLDWLIAQQKPDGRWGDDLAHALATTVLAEFTGATGDTALKGCAQHGVDSIIAQQYRDLDGLLLGWANDETQPTRMDAWTSVFNVLAVKSAKAAGLQTGTSLDGARTYLERAWLAANRAQKLTDPYTDISIFPAFWDCADDTVQAAGPMGSDLTAPAALAAIFLGFKSDNPMLNSMANHVMLRTPKSYPCDLSDLYFGTIVMFQLGRDRHDRWEEKTRKVIFDGQCLKPDCLAGSWDGGSLFRGEPVGRMFSTTLCCLSREIYYIY